jgi:citrate lyase beta subunit
MLFVPGTAQEKFAKIPELAPGSFILDLEDSVPNSEKERARLLVANLIETLGGQYELYVRINARSSPYFADDLAAIVRPGLSGVVVPKVEQPEDVTVINALIDSLVVDLGQDLDTVDVMATIETAVGVRSAYDIAAAGGRLTRLCFGGGDFALDLGLDWPDEEGDSTIVLMAKSQLVLASRVSGLEPPHDGAYTNYRDPVGLAREARQSRRLGFSGKHVIHPSQISVVDEIFRPNPKEIVRARGLIEAFEVAERSGSGAIGVNGELVDYAILKRARRLLGGIQE